MCHRDDERWIAAPLWADDESHCKRISLEQGPSYARAQGPRRKRVRRFDDPLCCAFEIIEKAIADSGASVDQVVIDFMSNLDDYFVERFDPKQA